MSDFDRGQGVGAEFPPGMEWARCGGVTASGRRCLRERIVPLNTPYRCMHHPLRRNR